jgi:hypothetical protein
MYSYSPLIARHDSEGQQDSYVGDEDEVNSENDHFINPSNDAEAVMARSVSQDLDPDATRDDIDGDKDTQATPLHANINCSTRRYQESSCDHSWNAITFRYQRLIVSLFLCILLAGFYFMPLFIQYTDSTFHPVPGSLSAQALQVFDSHFYFLPYALRPSSYVTLLCY